MLDGVFTLKVAETAVDTYIGRAERDRNVTFHVHSTANSRLIGYTLTARPASRDRPDLTIGAHYLGCFYSRLYDLRDREGRDVSVLYHDQNVRLLVFGTKPSARDYLLVLRNRGG
jgi:hypothetical protein